MWELCVYAVDAGEREEAQPLAIRAPRRRYVWLHVCGGLPSRAYGMKRGGKGLLGMSGTSAAKRALELED